MISWSQKTIAAFAVFSLLSSAHGIAMPSATPIPEDTTAPSQQRIAFAGDGGIAVSWNTYEQIENPVVKYGTSPNSLTQTASSDISQTYRTSTTWSNHVKLSGLSPSTTYYYSVSNSDASQVYSFTTPPEKYDQEGFTFAMVVDLGTMGPLGLSDVTDSGSGALLPGERNTIQALKDNIEEFKFVWQPGDLAYADYWLKEMIQGYLPKVPIDQGYKVYESILNAFYEEISVIASQVPYMVGPGNHESNCDDGGYKNYTVSICSPGQTNFTGYNSHWRMPSSESGGTDNMWFSYDYGPVHFVQFNTETDLGNGLIGPDEPNGSAGEDSGPFGAYPNQQIDWLNKDLASVDRCKTPWIIVAGHRPWYSSGGSKNVCSECQEAFEDVLIKYDVDLAVFGHVHNYQRYAPMANNKPDPNGLNNPSSPWYIVNGAAGHYDGMDPMGKVLNGMVFGFDNTYGWSRLTVHNSTHLTHDFVASRNNTVMDSATLFKRHEYAACPGPINSTSSLSTSYSSASSTSISTVSKTSSLTSGSESTSIYSYSLTSPAEITTTVTDCTTCDSASSGSAESESTSTYSYSLTSPSESTVTVTDSHCTTCEPTSSGSAATTESFTIITTTVTEPCSPTTISSSIVSETVVTKTMTVPCSEEASSSTYSYSLTSPEESTVTVTDCSTCESTSESSAVTSSPTSPVESTLTVTDECSECEKTSSAATYPISSAVEPANTGSPSSNHSTTVEQVEPSSSVAQANSAAAPILSQMLEAVAIAIFGALVL